MVVNAGEVANGAQTIASRGCKLFHLVLAFQAANNLGPRIGNRTAAGAFLTEHQ
jgi:hypothetical protein